MPPELPKPAIAGGRAGAADVGRALLKAALEATAASTSSARASSGSPSRTPKWFGDPSPAAGAAHIKEVDPEDGEGQKDELDDEECEKPAMGWALLRSALGGVMGFSPGKPNEKVPGGACQGSDLGERSFDIADSMEQGFARETATDFTTPLRRSSKLWRFRVVRSEDKLSSRLLTDTGDFLMFAQVSLEACCIFFYLYDPGGREKDLFDRSSPAFSMSFDKSRSEWRLVQERCANCQFSPKHLSCASRGKQQVAFIKHLRFPVGDGMSNVMEARIPGLYADGTCVVWCPVLGKGDLALAEDDNYETQQLITKEPVWNEQVESLVLDFKGRNVLSSAKNFQLALRQKPKHVICQFGKLGPTNFGLDFRYPLSVIQAFAMAMSTIFWT